MAAWAIFSILASLASAHLPSNLPPAGVMLSQAEALKSAFPDGFVRRTLLLEPAQASRIEKETGVQLPSSMVIAYQEASQNGSWAFFDRVAAGQSFVIVMTKVAADGSLAGIQVLASDMPAAFLPPSGWLARVQGLRGPRLPWSSSGLKTPHEALAAAEAVLGAAQRALAVFQAVAPASGPSTAAAVDRS